MFQGLLEFAPLRCIYFWTGAFNILLAISGCASNSGLLIADVIRAEGSWVVTVEGCCATLRTAAGDGGLSVGYDRRSYVYPLQIDDPPSEGRHYLWVQLPREAPLAFNNRLIGLDIRATGIDLGLTLGYRNATVLARLSSADAVYMRLRFAPDAPSATRLIYCEGDVPCWPIDLSGAAPLYWRRPLRCHSLRAPRRRTNSISRQQRCSASMPA